jgi:hypothetical protein
VWSASPTWRPLAALLGLVSSSVFYTLLVFVSSWIILIIIDTLILFLLFSGIINQQNLWKLSDKTPNFLFVDQLHALSRQVVMDINYRQHIFIYSL